MPIFDQGYQHWNGPLASNAWRWLAITRHGIRSQFANRWLKFMLLGCWSPALMLAGALALWGLLEQQSESVVPFLKQVLPGSLIDHPTTYRNAAWTLAFGIYFKVQLVLALLLVLIVGPNLISRDLRYNAFPLYFSRPIRRVDYFAGKLGVIAFFLALVAIAPPLGAYVLGVCFSLDLAVIQDTYQLVGASIIYGLVIIVSAGTLMLAMSSLSRRSVYVGIFWVGFWVVSNWTSSILVDMRQNRAVDEHVREVMERWVAENKPPPGVPMMNEWQPDLRGLRRVPRFGPEARWIEAWRHARDQSVAHGFAESARNDWRYLCSYSTNLDRVGDALLGTDAAWQRWGTITLRTETIAARMTWHYPWSWSAAVLAALVGLSLWILTTRVKTLDRLK
ncbi:MAG: ABC transporter permease [Gemmataceae bacterium]